ncbi:MAG: pyrroline-5-carboxylate reductase [Candidatus Methanomethylicota archaeon]|uniref:Pyrroline-5-carboxylate reductase n=1 Tax=Thermoproteota archaeon TaxID=2056631 RepID=A0A497F0Z5_9CREN|nr:MAG: pyrroline-5-carboxylate reductase [Candidatus Verstraetearchaeota archaeon]
MTSCTNLKVLASVRHRRDDLLNYFQGSGVEITFNNRLLIEQYDLVLLCVKPSQVFDVLREVGDLLHCKVLISMVALIPLSWFRRRLGDDVVLFRAMTNISALSNSSFTALSRDVAYSDEIERAVEDLFRVLGEVVWVEEHVLDALTIISGCGPALVAELIDAFILGSMAIGIPEHVARRAVFKLFEGTVKSLGVLSASELRNRVITPRGLTIKMLKDAYGRGVKSSLIEALESTYNEMLYIQRKLID